MSESLSFDEAMRQIDECLKASADPVAGLARSIGWLAVRLHEYTRGHLEIERDKLSWERERYALETSQRDKDRVVQQAQVEAMSRQAEVMKGGIEVRTPKDDY